MRSPGTALGRRDTSIRTGVWIGIGAISMSFAAYTSAMLVRRTSAGDWTPMPLPPLLYLNTLVLLASSVTMHFGASGASLGRRAWLQWTGVLGLLFVGGQVLAWRMLVAQHIVLGGSPSSAFFYVLTGLHALHLLGGLTALAVLLRRLSAPRPPSPATLGAMSLYWHFMGVLWLYLLLVLASGL